MEVFFFMGLVTPLIQFCRVISSGTIEPSSPLLVVSLFLTSTVLSVEYFRL